MDSNVYVNNNDLVENYFVRIDEKKIRQIQNEIDKWNGKGELLTKVGRGFFAADPEFFGKKIEVISKKFAGRKEFFDYCCPDVYMADVYEFKFLAYEQCDISKMCDELVSNCDKIDLSRLIKKLFEYTSSDEKKMEFVESLIDCIQLKKINDAEIKKIDLTVEQKESLLKRIIHVIKRKTTNTPFIIVASDDYEKAVDKKIHSMDCLNHAFRPPYNEEERKIVKQNILKSLPTKTLITSRR